MGLLSKIKEKIVPIVTAPVTAPLKVFSNVVDNVAPGNELAAKLSDAASAPYAYTTGQKSLGEAINQAKPALSLAASVAGTAGVGFDTGLLSSLTSLGGSNQPVPSTTNPFYYTDNPGSQQPTGYDAGIGTAQKNQQILFFGALGAGALLIFLATRR